MTAPSDSASRPMRGDARISPTAYATASAWARYGFADAELFDSRRGRAMLAALDAGAWLAGWWSPSLGAGSEILYRRHSAFTAWLAAQQPNQVIEIGAGLSARGLAWARAHPECAWHDLDLAGMVAARRRRLAGVDLPAGYHLAEGDLLNPALGRDITAQQPPGCVVALTEGVVEYLGPAAKHYAWSHIAQMLRRLGGGRYLCEIYPRDRLLGRLNNAPGLAARLAPSLSPDIDTALAGLRAAGFAKARLRSESERSAERSHAPIFCLLEAET